MGNSLSTNGPAVSRQIQLELTQHRLESLSPTSSHRLQEIWKNYKVPGQNLADFDVLNELFTASLDSKRLDLAKEILDVISSTFPSDVSTRTKMLEANLEEARGNFGKAEEAYKQILKDDEANIKAWKRLIAMSKRVEAIELLTKYLDTFSDDQEAWLHLCNLYQEEHAYAQATFCSEELILLDPTNHLYQIKLADLLYTRGNLKDALKFYCRSLELCPHLRALYGIQQCCRGLLSGRVEDSRLKFQWIDLLEMSKRMIESRSKSQSHSNDVAKEWLNAYNVIE